MKKEDKEESKEGSSDHCNRGRYYCTKKRYGGPFSPAFGMLSFITPKLEKEEKLKEQIVRYDESWLAFLNNKMFDIE